MKYYAVRKGRKTGIFTTWDETVKQVSGFSGAEYKSFKTRAAAETFLGQSEQPQNDSHRKENQSKFQEIVGRPVELDLSDEIVVYTDGGTRNHGNRAGGHVKADDKAAWAYLIMIAGADAVADTGGEYGATNNRMEIMGLLQALTYLIDHHLEKRSVTVVADSKYVLDAITKGWLESWQRRGWKRSAGPLLNKELWQRVADLLKKFPNIHYQWTKGHSDNDGNVFVDQLLNQTMDQMAPKENRGGKVTLPKLEIKQPKDQKNASVPSHHESKKRKIKLDTESIHPSQPTPEKLSPEVEKSVHDIEESLKQLGLFDDDHHQH